MVKHDFFFLADKGDTTNLEIDFYSEVDKKRFLDDFQKAQNYMDPGNYGQHYTTTISSPNSLGT